MVDVTTPIVPDPVPKITIDDLTTVDKKEGTGTFDILMRSVKEHMADEYTQGRIQGAEYATVYLGALQQTMQQSIAFLLAKDKQSYELTLLQLQADMLELSKQEMDAKIALLEAQTAKVEQDTALAVLQECNVAAECLQIQAQTCKLQAEFDLVIQQIPKVLAETELLMLQKNKVQADIDKSLMEVQVLITTQNKIGKEIELLAQKFFTERAQTNPEFTSEGSVVGAQTKLYQEQTKGFKRNAEQKAADIMIQTWNTRRMTDDAVAGDPSTNRLDDATIGTFVSALQSGVLNNP